LKRQAAEASPQRHLGHREVGPVQQALGPLHARGLRHLERAGADVALEQAAEVARADAHLLGERLRPGVLAVKRTPSDQSQRALGRGARAVPGRAEWRRLGAAPQARPKTAASAAGADGQ
jgi:hypothetical protein